MLSSQLNYGLYLSSLLAFTGAFAFPSLEARKTVSTDGTCSSTITCVGSKFGDCCSQYGYCGSTPAHCGTGTKSNVTSDGTCGKDKNGLTCQGSTFGNCCSAHGYCGSTSDHCGTGCQAGYGTCGSSSSSNPSSTQSSTPSSTRTTTSTSTSAPAATSTASATPVSICNAGTNVVQNPSFEDGLSPWTATGGTAVQSNGQDKIWYFAATSGSKYIKLESSAAHPNSSLTQSVSISGYRATLSFDWSFMVSSTSRGPPSTKCTMLVQWGYEGFYTLASWTRPGASGGTGHEETTFDTGIGSGDLVFSFACTSTDYNSGLLIDNVQMRGC